MGHSKFKEEHLVMAAFAIVLLLIVTFFNKFRPNGPASVPSETAGPSVDPCAIPVTASCEVVVEREFSNCEGTTRINETIAALLAQPEESDRCREAELKIGAPCPAGCIVDFSSLYRLAGNVEVNFLTRTENGCLVRGKRVMKMRASCTQDAKYVDPTESMPPPK